MHTNISTEISTEMCGSSPVFGCRFSLYPMSDRFVEIILGALKEVDTSKVWMETDDVSTCIRGRESHVFDVVKAIFVHAAKKGVHVVLSATFSYGCPGEHDADVFLVQDDQRLNEPFSSLHQIETAANFSIYPLGTTAYFEQILRVIELAKKQGTFTKGVHYTSRLDGDVHQIFTTLEDSIRLIQETDTNHLVITVVLSANSPSKKN